MNRINSLNVYIYGDKVGTMALMRDHTIAFEYDAHWLENGFPISPFSLPLEKKVFIPKPTPFDGLYGVFADSLPDGWGRLLVDRMLLKEGINPATVNNLNRLALISDSSMGALTYKPTHELPTHISTDDLDKLALECKSLLQTDYSEDLDELFILGGSSGGARPKILTKYNGADWIIKFPSSLDRDNIGEREYQYSLCAKSCGIEMPETRLFPSKYCPGYFGVKRFDRQTDNNGTVNRVHMLSVSALLETTHRLPNLDYNILMKLTLELTKEYQEVEKMFRLMCFNVFSHNRDDHSKNFSFLYDRNSDKWRLSPAYDLTYSNSIGGEHATTVNGNGTNPGTKELLEVANIIGLNKSTAKNICAEIAEKTQPLLLNR